MSLALLVDATSVYAFQKHLKDDGYSVQGNINYGALLDALRKEFKDDMDANSNNNLFDKMLGFVSINPEHEGQQKFCAYLQGQGFTVIETDFRDAFIVPDRKTEYQRLSSRLTYVAGMLTAPYASNSEGNPIKREIPHLVIVTDAFDTYYALLDYVQNRNGRVTIVFFHSGMEERWRRAGLFDEDSPIEFCDLSQYAKAIVGVDLGTSLGAKKGGKGLADFNL